jgi:iduronate 2-sulfatase
MAVMSAVSSSLCRDNLPEGLVARKSGTLLTALLIIQLILICACGGGKEGTAPVSPPNILFIIVDDLNCRIGCYGDPVANSPNLDRLASMGVRFERAYCQFPVCNSTRCSVFTSLYPTTTGVLDNNTFLVLGKDHETMQDHFRHRGYAVAEFGKVWHGANRMLRPGESVPDLAAEEPRRPGWNQDWFTPAELAALQADDPDYWDKHHSPYRNLAPPDPQLYAWANVFGPLPEGDRGIDAPIADDAIRALREFREGDKPFFLAVGFHRPHVPLTAPREYFDLYDASLMPLPPDFNNEVTGPEGTPVDELRDNMDLFASRTFTATEAREAMRAYYACITYVDAQLGRVMDELERLELAEHTIIVLWGDHGWHLSEKGMWAKGTTFEVSAHGPMIIADPRRKSAGRSSTRVVQYLDLYPTLADLCGIGIPEGLEGRSLKPLLDQPDRVWDHPAITVQSRSWYIGRSIRTERWRYTEWDQGRRGAMLFDHDHDPHEMHNLANDPSYQKIVEELKIKLDQSGVGR